ncbi:MAG: tetratricopeptide repeat protein [Promethearchaeota archaeon]
MTVREELTHIRRLKYQGELKKALLEVEKLEAREITNEEQLECQLAKSAILRRMGRIHEALEITKHVLREAEKQDNPLLVIDSLLWQADFSFHLGRYNEHKTLIQRCESLIEQITLEESQIKRRIATVLFHKGVMSHITGDVSEGISYLKKSLAIQEEIDRKDPLVTIALFYLASYHRDRGDNKEASSCSQRSMKLSKETGNNLFLGYNLMNLGLGFHYTGEFEKALKYYEESLSIVTKSQMKPGIALLMIMFATTYRHLGELTLAFEHIKKGITLYEEMEIRDQFYAYSFCINAQLLQESGDFTEAFTYYEKSLLLFHELGVTNALVFETFYCLVKLSVEGNFPEKAEPYLQFLEQLNRESENILLKQGYRGIQGLLLRKSNRFKDKVKAQTIHRQNLEEEKSHFFIKKEALLNLIDLLLEELKLTGNRDILREIKELINQLIKFAQNQSSYNLIAEAYLLQSKLALLDLNTEKAIELLTQVRQIAETKGLERLSMLISYEQESLVSQLNKWERIIEQEPSMSDIIQLTQIEDLITRVINTRLLRKEEEIREYTIRARQLVEKWEKA